MNTDNPYPDDEILTRFRNVFSGDISESVARWLSCPEVDALADLLRHLGDPDAAGHWITDHAEFDECGDRHHNGCDKCTDSSGDDRTVDPTPAHTRTPQIYKTVTATLDETYTRLDRPGRFGAVRQYQFTIMPSTECSHDNSSVCSACAREWTDYEFDDDFPFERGPRIGIRDLIDAGHIQVGSVLTNDSHPGASAVVTGDGGLLLPDGRIYSNPSAAAHAVRRMSGNPGPDTCPN